MSELNFYAYSEFKSKLLHYLIWKKEKLKLDTLQLKQEIEIIDELTGFLVDIDKKSP